MENEDKKLTEEAKTPEVKKKMADALGYGNMLGNAETKRQASAIQTAQAAGADTSNPAVQDVMSNLTKDYRGVMKALDKRDGKQ